MKPPKIPLKDKQAETNDVFDSIVSFVSLGDVIVYLVTKRIFIRY